MQMLAYKFRAYPSKVRQAILDRQMQLAKSLYNTLLEKSLQHYKETKKTFTRYEMNKWITQIKRENPEFKSMHSQVLQNVADRVSKSYNNFFCRIRARKTGKKLKVGFPRYKSYVSSLTYPQFGFRMSRKTAQLSGVGSINFVNHREIQGKSKTLTIKKAKSGEWYITISAETEAAPVPSNKKTEVGIDLGLRDYTTLSNGIKIQNPRLLDKSLNKLRKAQRGLSRRKKGGKNRRKAALKVARISEGISRQRNDFLHKLSHNLVNSYSFIAYEKLNIKGMAGNHHLARSINDASWSHFIQYLCYKAESAGCKVVGVNPRNTTKTCSKCGNVQNIELSERTFNCKNCGISIDRDLNAAINILSTAGHAGSYALGDLPSTSKTVDARLVVELGTTYNRI